MLQSVLDSVTQSRLGVARDSQSLGRKCLRPERKLLGPTSSYYSTSKGDLPGLLLMNRNQAKSKGSTLI